MDKNPLISILTLTFNHRDFIKQTIYSVLNQTYQNWEWIILDDGSTDGTGDIINSIKDSRIQYTLQEHAGINHLTKTYNKALAMCNGDLIATLDGDDYWPKYKLEIQVQSLNSPDIVLSHGESWIVNQRGQEIAYISLPDDASIACNNPVGSALKKLLEERYCFIVNPTVMYRKSALLSIGGFMEVEGIGEDFPTWVRLSLEDTFSAIPICLGYYRKHTSSLSLRKDQDRIFEYHTNFLKRFILQNEQKLHELGISYSMDRLEKHWEEIRTYLPYNRAMLLLTLGLLKDARFEFSRFLMKYPSIKHKMIYFIITLSGLINFDLVNPFATLKAKLRKLF